MQVKAAFAGIEFNRDILQCLANFSGFRIFEDFFESIDRQGLLSDKQKTFDDVFYIFHYW